MSMRKSSENDLTNEKTSKKHMKYDKQMEQENTYSGERHIKTKE